VLPAAASFKKQGANKGALASFLVSTPESGIDSIAITYALLDPIMTVVRPVAAFITGLGAGILENSVSFSEQSEPREAEEQQPAGCCSSGYQKKTSAPSPGIRSKLFAGIRYGCVDVWGDIVFWFFAGLLLAGIITVFIPEHLSEMVLGGGLVSMFAMLLIGMPVYICATASTPVAAALLMQGASPGAVLVFLLAGPATNMTSLSVLFSILGKMGTLRYLFVIAGSSIIFGLGLDWLYGYFSIEPRAIIEEVRETLPHWIKLLSAVVLLSLSVYHLYLRFEKKLAQKKSYQFLTGYPTLHLAKQSEKCNYSKQKQHR